MFRQLLIFLIKTLRPLLGPAHCLYPLSCTAYACMLLKEKSFLKACILIFMRLICCNPLTPLLTRLRTKSASSWFSTRTN